MEKDRVNALRMEKMNTDRRLAEMKEINSEKIYYLEEEMDIVKTELIFIRNIQREYYSKLLKKGDDIRGKGLIWIIEQMWELEFKVYKNMFPDAMDELSKDYLLDISKKEYELNKEKHLYSKYKI
jgi:hypothetical protein